MNLRFKRDTLEKKEMYCHPPPRRQNPAIVSILQSERAFRFRIFFRTNFNAHFNMNMYVTLSSTCFGP